MSWVKTPNMPQNTPNKFICLLCNFSTNNKKDYNRHLLTNKHKINTENENKTYKYICECCNYNTNNKYDYNKHLSSIKHNSNNNTISITNEKKKTNNEM